MTASSIATVTAAGLTRMAVARLQAHYDRYGIDDTMIDICRRFEAMIAKAHGEAQGLDGLGQRCLNREPGTTACLLPVDHDGDCDWKQDPSYKERPPIVYDEASAAYRRTS